MTEKKRGVIPRKIKGFRDITPAMNRRRWQVINAAARVYQSYGFEHRDTPVMEYAECIGKYLPGEDAGATIPEGLYSFVNPETEPVYYDDWSIAMEGENTIMDRFPLALRYDLTAPLARMYAEMLWSEKVNGAVKTDKSPLFRRYQVGRPLYRFEAKLDPGRFREFWQLDFDTVGTADLTADSENVMILADAMEAIGMKRGTYVVKANNRKIMQGFLDGLDVRDDAYAQNILRVIDKLDKIGLDGVRGELCKGREDEVSKAFVPGLNLPDETANRIVDFFKSFAGVTLRRDVLNGLKHAAGNSEWLQSAWKNYIRSIPSLPVSDSMKHVYGLIRRLSAAWRIILVGIRGGIAFVLH